MEIKCNLQISERLINLCIVFVDDIKSYDRIWMIGDEFMLNSYNQFSDDVRGPDGKLEYIKAHYDTTGYCNASRNISLGNVLAKLCDLLVLGINEQALLPKAILIVLDDDLLDALDHYKPGITTAIGKMVEWIANQYHRIIVS